MKSETRKDLSDYFKAVGVSEMPRRKKKQYKRACRIAAMAHEQWFIGVQRWAQTRADPRWNHLPVFYPGTEPYSVKKFNLQDPAETDGSFRLTFDGGITQES